MENYESLTILAMKEWLDIVTNVVTIIVAIWIPIQIHNWNKKEKEEERKFQLYRSLIPSLHEIRDEIKQGFKQYEEKEVIDLETLKIFQNDMSFKLNLIENTLGSEILSKVEGAAKLSVSPEFGSYKVLKHKYGDVAGPLFHLARVGAMTASILQYIANPSFFTISESLKEQGEKRISDFENEYFKSIEESNAE